MEQNLEELLTKTTKNFKLAEEQYLESSEETDLSLRKLRKMNYDNATNILNLVEDMAGKNKTVQKQNPNIKERTSKAGRIVLNTQQPSDNGLIWVMMTMITIRIMVRSNCSSRAMTKFKKMRKMILKLQSQLVIFCVKPQSRLLLVAVQRSLLRKKITTARMNLV